MSLFTRYGPGLLVLMLALLAARTITLAVVTGESMHPALDSGDICLVVRSDAYTRGDIVLCSPAGRTRVLHRVVSTGQRGVRTKGDANDSADREPVPASRVEGRVVGVLRLSTLIHLVSNAVGDKLLNQS